MHIAYTLRLFSLYFRTDPIRIPQLHVLTERDDWKALVDSVQKDRARLTEECAALENQLELANIENERLSKELEIASGKVILG